MSQEKQNTGNLLETHENNFVDTQRLVNMIKSSQRAKVHVSENTRGEFTFVKLDMSKQRIHCFYGAGLDRRLNRHFVDWWVEYICPDWLPQEAGQGRKSIVKLVLESRDKSATFLKARIKALGGEGIAFKKHGVKVDTRGLTETRTKQLAEKKASDKRR